MEFFFVIPFSESQETRPLGFPKARSSVILSPDIGQEQTSVLGKAREPDESQFAR